MKALVIRQPWAWAIMAGYKRFENRSWTTKYRGPFAIIAGSSKASLQCGREFCEQNGIAVPVDLPFGCILGVINLIDIILPSQSDDVFAEGPFCWRLESPVLLDHPVPYRGQLGLFQLAASRQTENLEAIAANLVGTGP